MLRSRTFKIICAALLAALSLFSFTPPGQWCLVHLAQKTGLTDFQTVSRRYPFSLHVLSVGKADALCVLVEDTAFLIDGGTADVGEDVADYLMRLGVTELAAVFNTHPDDDHIGGLASVLRRFPCRVFYAPSVPEDLLPDTREVAQVQAVLKEKAVPVQTLSEGNVIMAGALRIEVLSPGPIGDESNNNSLVLRLVYGEQAFLLMGDAEAEVEERLLLSGKELSADVLKVGHHGSNTSTTAEFLQAVAPRFAVISTGEDNNHLPRIPVLRRLERCEALYRTDADGTVILCSDGETLTVYTKK